MQLLSNSVKSVEAAIDPNNRLTFLLDWELTLKCNLDCDYCETGLYGGHDNSTRHPPVTDCLRSIDFMFEYVDYAMSQRRSSLHSVILNVYGGESLHHPDIVNILQAAHDKYKPFRDRWTLRVCTTTNLIVSKDRLEKIIPLIDVFTVSYHAVNTEKQKQQFRDNCLAVKAAGRDIKCVVLMHAEPELFADAQAQIQWCQDHNIKHLPRALDRPADQHQFDYRPNQIQWFNSLYTKKSHRVSVDIDADQPMNLSEPGRACCGGRQVCVDQNYRQRHFYVPNKFTDWYCSVNHFFLYVKQVTGEVFVNKDCKMNFDGTVGPIGLLSDTESILHQQQNNPGTIKCAKSFCLCGLCAPKAQDLETYNEIISKYIL